MKAKYLSVIRITTQLVAPCPCYLTHTYCATAYVLQKRITYCLVCKAPLQLRLVKHPSRIVNFLIKNLALTLVATITILGIVLLDGFIKCRSNTQSKQYQGLKEFMDVCVSWNGMLLMSMMLLPLSLWSCAVQFSKKQTKENINYFEILPMSEEEVISHA